MAQRRELVSMLEAAGFRSMGETKHERLTNGKVVVQVKRHREIEDAAAKRTLKQAGLR